MTKPNKSFEGVDQHKIRIRMNQAFHDACGCAHLFEATFITIILLFNGKPRERHHHS